MTILYTRTRYTDEERLHRFKVIVTALQSAPTNMITASALYCLSSRFRARSLPALASEMWRDRNAMSASWEYKNTWTDDDYVTAVVGRRLLMAQAGVVLDGSIVLTRDQIYIPDHPTREQSKNISHFNRVVERHDTYNIAVIYNTVPVLRLTTYQKLQWIGENEHLVRAIFPPERVDILFKLYDEERRYLTGKLPKWIDDIYVATNPHLDHTLDIATPKMYSILN